MRKKSMLLSLLVVVMSILAACQGAETPLSGEFATPTTVKSTSTPAQELFNSPVPQSSTFESPVTPAESPQKSTQVAALFPGKIAFHSNRTGLLEVYILDGKTGQVERVTSYNEEAFEPSWAPDCESIIFSSGSNSDSNIEVYKMDLDGNNVSTNLSNHPERDDWMGAWSPKGDLIAYQSNFEGRLNVCFMDLNGQDKGCIERDAYNNALPAWSPDGSMIVFISDRDGDWEIFTASVEGDTEAIQLTDNNYTDTHPQFSPDGTKIAFSADPYTNYDVFVMDIDGSDAVRLTIDPEDEVMPHWMGNERLVFASEKTQDWELYLMDSDGANVEQITNTPGLDKWPVWCSTE